MSKYYRRRLASLEEKKNTRKAFFFVALTVIFLTLFLFIGLPSLGKLLGFVSDLKKTNTVSNSYDVTPPAPPSFNFIPEAVNKPNFEIKGKTEEGATIIIDFNGKSEEIIADSEGNFSYNVSLSDGENTFSATAKDSSNNESVKSDTVTIIYDATPPKLEISSPSDGATFYGSMQKNLEIKGITEPGVTLTMNDRSIGVSAEDGSFSYFHTLSEGSNSFNFKSTDKAGNQTEITYTVNFSI